MSARNKPYEQFGPYVLFKRIEASPLGDLWRAAKVDANTIASVVALRRLTGGNRDAVVSAIGLARQVAPLLIGSSFVKEQVIDVIGGVPFVAHAYAGGRSLRHIVDRARGASGSQPNPIPADQALVIAEKVALSLGTIGELRFAGEKLAHGALLPEFVWICDDGEIRVAGQQLGQGVRTYANHFLSPEYQHNGQVTKASEVYSVGAILYLTLTGLEPPDPTSTSAFAAAIRAAKTMAGTRMPEEIQAILNKSLNLDPNMRFASVGDMKSALSALTSGGKYSATSFNLAMYLSSLLKKELEGEAIEREKEAKTNFTPYIEALTNPPAAAAAPSIAVPQPTAKERRTAVPIGIAASLALGLLGGGAYFMLGAKKAAPIAAQPKQLASAMAAAAPKKPAPVIPEPILASPAAQRAASITAPAGTTDDAAQKRAFEDAVRQKLHEEMMKLQSEYTAKLQKEHTRNAPVQVAQQQQPVTQVAEAAPRPVETHSDPSAAQLDAQRLPATTDSTPAQVIAPSTTATAAVVETQTQPPSPVVPQVKEGDVVDVTEVDVVPRRTRDPRIIYPPMAARERAEANILTTLLVSETGEVVDVKILRGDARFGFNDAAVRALKASRYTPAVKDGKRVKTWLPQMIQFKP
ncbi:MAG TPA: TonB family protein [Thermoanaerobaculia bacterium]|nr:TonB family protein [Thermoanaerobaculia bacterium]